MERHLNNQDIVHATGSLLVQRLNEQTDPREKITTGMSVAFNAITTTAAMLMGTQFDARNGKFPTNDHCLLALLLIHEGATMMTDATVRVEFSPYRLHEALEDFQRFTGRDGKGLLDDNLRTALERVTKVDASKFGANGKFLQ
jgi:hypothetical protein